MKAPARFGFGAGGSTENASSDTQSSDGAGSESVSDYEDDGSPSDFDPMQGSEEATSAGMSESEDDAPAADPDAPLPEVGQDNPSDGDTEREENSPAGGDGHGQGRLSDGDTEREESPPSPGLVLGDTGGLGGGPGAPLSVGSSSGEEQGLGAEGGHQEQKQEGARVQKQQQQQQPQQQQQQQEQQEQKQQEQKQRGKGKGRRVGGRAPSGMGWETALAATGARSRTPPRSPAASLGEVDTNSASRKRHRTPGKSGSPPPSKTHTAKRLTYNNNQT